VNLRPKEARLKIHELGFALAQIRQHAEEALEELEP